MDRSEAEQVMSPTYRPDNEKDPWDVPVGIFMIGVTIAAFVLIVVLAVAVT